ANIFVECFSNYQSFSQYGAIKIKNKLSLRREVGLVGAVSLIGGTMIGSGIFMSPQTVLSTIGSPGASLVVWACCGLLVILAESGGEYIYILRTSGPVVAFLLIFSSVLFVRPAGVAGIALSFAQYVVAPFYADCPPPVILGNQLMFPIFTKQ
uniref:Zmp:0000001267 n=1 Tax=Amphiprion percula TaxID=161767 RepID=A0A3P8RMP9_AMPPE